jgi:hypothetical protein
MGGKLPTQPGEATVEQTAGVGAGSAVAFAIALMEITNVIGWTVFTTDEKLVIVGAVGVVAPTVAALVARMHVWAGEK